MSREIDLSVLITVVSGTQSLRRCLAAVRPQLDFGRMEIIVPYDQWSRDVGDLVAEFPEVHFHFIDDLGMASSENVPAHSHRLHDRRRAVGLGLATGRVIAMTEDHAVPADDWCRQILAVHEQPHAVIGGAIDNAVDRPMNWALYYCDFGRYGTPLRCGDAKYASDVNLAYKRVALEAVRDVWRDAYHETNVHWTLRSRRAIIFLDSRMLVYQHRPPIGLGQAYRERMEWGRVFAETRVAEEGFWRSVWYAAGTPLLPLLLLLRVARHMSRQGRSASQMTKTLPLAMCLLTGWAWGELLGYLAGPPSPAVALSARPRTDRS